MILVIIFQITVDVFLLNSFQYFLWILVIESDNIAEYNNSWCFGEFIFALIKNSDENIDEVYIDELLTGHLRLSCDIFDSLYCIEFSYFVFIHVLQHSGKDLEGLLSHSPLLLEMIIVMIIVIIIVIIDIIGDFLQLSSSIEKILTQSSHGFPLNLFLLVLEYDISQYFCEAKTIYFTIYGSCMSNDNIIDIFIYTSWLSLWYCIVSCGPLNYSLDP